MSLYQHTTTQEVREIDDRLHAAWDAAGNPKASHWIPYTPPPAEPPVPTRNDYKAALDAMLQAQAERRDYDNIVQAASRAARSGPFYAEGCWYFDLRDFTWFTSGQREQQPPTENPPTPEELAQYILGQFVAQQGDIPARA